MRTNEAFRWPCEADGQVRQDGRQARGKHGTGWLTNGSGADGKQCASEAISASTLEGREVLATQRGVGISACPWPLRKPSGALDPPNLGSCFFEKPTTFLTAQAPTQFVTSSR